MNEIKLNQDGLVLEGKYKRSYIYIKDDRDGSTGGFYIFITEPEKINDGYGYDFWLENLNDLKIAFEQSKWKVKWLEDSASPFDLSRRP